MIVNTWHLTLRDDLSDEDRQLVLSTLQSVADLDSVTFSTVGVDPFDSSEQKVAYSVGFASLADFERYVFDPVHLGSADVVFPRVTAASGHSCAEKHVAAQVAAIMGRKATEHPTWADGAAEIVTR